MNRFNLSFKGNILPGYELGRVQARLAKALGLPGPENAAAFFSGKPVTLRRNLDRKVAADWYRKLRDIGMDVELVKATDAITSESKSPAPEKTTSATPPARESASADKSSATEAVQSTHRGMNTEIHQSRPGQVDQSWAVPSSSPRAKDRTQKAAKEVKAEVSAEQRQARAEADARLAADKAAEAARREQLEAQARRDALAQREAQAEAEREAIRKADAARIAQEQARLEAQAQAEREAIRQAEEARIAQEQAQREAQAQAERDKLAQEAAQRQREKQLEAERLAAAQAARAHAAALEAKRLATAEDARRRALEQEREREAARELARKKAQEKQRKAEEAARAKAEREATKARLKAERDESRRQARAAAAQAKAAQKKAQDEAKRKAREEALRVQAEKAEAARLAAEKIAQEKARQDAMRIQREAEIAEQKARAEEARLLAAAEAARQQAEQEHLKAEAAAKLQAQQEEARLAQQLARAEAEQARKAKTAARRQEREARAAELKAQKQQQAAENRRKSRAEAERRAHEQAERARAEALALAEKAELEEQIIARGAARLGDASALGGDKPRVKTRLEVPTRRSPVPNTDTPADTAPAASRHQQGAPNLYTLTAFANSRALQGRSAESASRAKRGTLVVASALAMLCISVLAFTFRTPEPLIHGPVAISGNDNGELALLAGDNLYLHDRAGLGTQKLTAAELGLDALRAPLLLSATNGLFALGIPSESNEGAKLLRCDLADKQCTTAITDPTDHAIASFAINALNGDRYVLSEQPARLQRYSEQGSLLAETGIPGAEEPVMRLDSGLIFVSSQFGAAISVFRPDIEHFGEQLDEVLLMPPSAVKNQHNVVLDFLPLEQHWWAILGNPDNNSSALYQFDASWRFVNALPLPSEYFPASLSSWNNKILVSHPSRSQQLRVSSLGQIEAPYESNLLLEAVSAQKSALARLNHLQRLLPAALLALTFMALAYTWVHRIRSRVYHKSKSHGAEPLKDATTIHWINHDSRRATRYRQLAILVAVGYLGVFTAGIGLGLPLRILVAMLLVMSGPAITLYLLYRTPVGHIGVRGESLVLVDHNGVYHIGEGPAIQYGSRFVLIDDVTLFTGASLLPTFEPAQLKTLEATITAGVKVQSKAIWVRLLQARHPLATGAAITFIGTIIAALVLIG